MEVLFQAFKRESKRVLAKEWQLIRKCMAGLVVFAFLAGLWLCLAANPAVSHHGPGSPSTAIHTAQACGTSGLVCVGQFGSNRLLLTSLLGTEQNTLYQDTWLVPPSPPPRG